jgi:hypothetical protein
MLQTGAQRLPSEHAVEKRSHGQERCKSQIRAKTHIRAAAWAAL